ncbi:MAG: 2-oxoglutarate dehydrogenase E1 component [Pirellulaceae bacterium]|nr:2-oxoglutarate dehydrogenase E1 component [Pirellulaceae bacterium]
MNTFSLAYIDDLFLDYVKDPAAVPAEWRSYFEAYAKVEAAGGTFDDLPKLPSFVPTGIDIANGVGTPLSSGQQEGGSSQETLVVASLQDRVDQLIRGYRARGHKKAQLDPLGLEKRDYPHELDPDKYGLKPDDLRRTFSTKTIQGPKERTLSEIIDLLESTYCRSIGAQFMHIDDWDIRAWLQNRMEGTRNDFPMSRETQLRILKRLVSAVTFEKTVRKKYVAQKSFSLEGGESLIPMLDMALEKAGEGNVPEVLIAMAHRGRLNVMANVMGKRMKNIFWAFDDLQPERYRGGGDVKYHLGYSTDWKTSLGKSVHLSLCFNPSHLEFVNPVAMGRARSKRERAKSLGHEHTDRMAILIHGDAAFAGEGIVQESLNLSELGAYETGGSLHIILNNQIGFTTTSEEARSSPYCSDIAKMLQIPIFHVNGEDPVAVAQVVNLAMDFRLKFKRDVVIDMYCYRRWGHNEGDEPRYTQPLMYEAIDKRSGVLDFYVEHLTKQGEVTQKDVDELVAESEAHMEEEFELAKNETFVSDEVSMTGIWEGYYGGPERDDDDCDTGIATEELSEILQGTCQLPEDFNLHRKLKRLFDQRCEMADGKRPLDWAAAEAAAFGYLATEGHPVRITGQDAGRGTFSHRHAVLHDTKTGDLYTPLKHLTENQALVAIHNSPLSEAAVLGFEYGYSLDHPDGLVAWEAQFGDFWNTAQVIVDQFITSAEDKWNRLSGLVMMLPHGFEGQGPEHCSARIERFLLLTAEHNIQVVQPTTPLQLFHVLVRQVKRKWRKPLVIMTPKSLLRHPKVVSPLESFATGNFQRVLPDERELGDGSGKRVLMCTGKIYYDLCQAREEQGRNDIEIIRVEQLYPLPEKELAQVLSRYPEGTEIFWVQDEPTNMGAWPFIRLNLGENIFGKYPLHRISRPESASPSTGSAAMHKIEQAELLEEALGGDPHGENHSQQANTEKCV